MAIQPVDPRIATEQRFRELTTLANNAHVDVMNILQRIGTTNPPTAREMRKTLQHWQDKAGDLATFILLNQHFVIFNLPTASPKVPYPAIGSEFDGLPLPISETPQHIISEDDSDGT